LAVRLPSVRPSDGLTNTLTQIPDLFKQHHKMLNKPNNSAYSQFNYCEKNALFRIFINALVAELFDVKVDEFLIFASFRSQNSLRHPLMFFKKLA